MNERKKITVAAQPGRTFPLHAQDNPTGGFMLIAPGSQCEVYESIEIRRGVRDGDLVVVDKSAPKSKAPEAASAK